MIYQVKNKRINAWVKMKEVGNNSTIMNVKEKEPTKPFKGVKIKRK